VAGLFFSREVLNQIAEGSGLIYDEAPDRKAQTSLMGSFFRRPFQSKPVAYTDTL